MVIFSYICPMEELYPIFSLLDSVSTYYYFELFGKFAFYAALIWLAYYAINRIWPKNDD